MSDFPLFDLAPAVYWLRGVFPFDLLALFAVMLFGFWTASWSLASSLRSTSSANTSNRAPKEGRL